jgi:hypothetical protein
MTTKNTNKKRGRPRKRPPIENPVEEASSVFSKAFSEIRVFSVYGLDEYTEYLIKTMYKDPQIVTIYATDPDESKLANFNRYMSGLKFSLYRWGALSHKGFVEEPPTSVMVVSKEHFENVMSRLKYDIEIVVLEELLNYAKQ